MPAHNRLIVEWPDIVYAGRSPQARQHPLDRQPCHWPRAGVGATER